MCGFTTAPAYNNKESTLKVRDAPPVVHKSTGEEILVSFMTPCLWKLLVVNVNSPS